MINPKISIKNDATPQLAEVMNVFLEIDIFGRTIIKSDKNISDNNSKSPILLITGDFFII